MRRDGAVIDDSEAGTGAVALVARRQDAFVEAVHHDRDLLEWNAVRTELSPIGLVHRQHGVSETGGRALDEPERTVEEPSGFVLEAHHEHVRGKVVDVQDHLRA